MKRVNLRIKQTTYISELFSIFIIYLFFFAINTFIKTEQLKAQETSAQAKQFGEKVEDTFDTVGDRTQSAWNQTKLAAFDAGETSSVNE